MTVSTEWPHHDRFARRQSEVVNECYVLEFPYFLGQCGGNIISGYKIVKAHCLHKMDDRGKLKIPIASIVSLYSYLHMIEAQTPLWQSGGFPRKNQFFSSVLG